MEMTREAKILLERLFKTDSKHRLTRSELVDLFGNDRKGRELIEELQRHGWWVISGYGKGYWLASNRDEYHSWRRRELTRALSILSKLRVMDRGVIKDDDRQLRMDDYISLLQEAERNCNV